MSTDNTPVVVGDDGSPEAGGAVQWAAQHAADTGSPLRLVHAVHVPVMGGIGWKVDASMEAGRLLHAMKGAGEELARRRRRWVLELHPDLQLESLVVLADPREALAHEGTSAGLLVVASRGHAAVKSLLLGSVSAFVIRHSPCPAVIYREPREPGSGVLVVARAGDDPSAFDFAASYAAAHRVPLTVLRESGTEHARARADEAGSRLDERISRFRRQSPGCEVGLEEVDRLDVGQVTTSRPPHELIVVERRQHARPLFEPAIATAEHSACPVAVVPSLPIATQTAASSARDLSASGT